MTEFQGVIPVFNQALTKRGYTELTSVQKAVLDPELEKRDLLVSAQTGSGKTVAFGLALVATLLEGAEKFSNAKAPMALVIAPTRELALQVKRELEWLYEPSGASVTSCVGGMDIRTERNALKRNPHIVVGTPGRLRDHIERGYFDTSKLKAVVLDEADEMLDMGFRDELQYILETAPKGRRTLLFSATVPKSIASLAKKYQNDAKRISTKEEKEQHADIEYQALTIAPSDRENAILNILRFHEAKNAIIFCATRAAVNTLTSRLTNRGFSVVALSGELSQNERTHALQALRDGRAQVCVATDVASRGIDLPGLALVIHADIPKNSDIMLHRSGRTGRAGSKGTSVLLVPHNGRFRAERLLNNAKITAKWDKPPSIEDVTKRDHERFLSHPALNEEIKETEQAAITELTEKFTPAQVAAALIRVHNTQRPAPEELLENAPKQKQRDNREGFNNSVWVSLSVGRNVNAEPRWILPMLCGAGNLTKGKIGSIKIQQNETFVELTADCVDSFFEKIGSSGKIEKDIVVSRVQGKPPMGSGGDGGRPKRTYNDKKKPYKKDGRSGERTNSRPNPGERSFEGKKKPYKKKFEDRGDSRDGKAGGGEKSKSGFKGKPKSGFKDKPKGDFKGKPKGGYKGGKPKSGGFKGKPKQGSRD